MAWFAGLRVKHISKEECGVTIKYKWLNQNPFQSIYFASLLMAAELTTGILVMREIQQSGEKISMLVVKINSEYHKKAIGRIRFSCADGILCKEVIQEALRSGEPQTLIMHSVGVDGESDEVSSVEIVWGIKLKQ